jgi:AcrR family transcriptional regulator
MTGKTRAKPAKTARAAKSVNAAKPTNTAKSGPRGPHAERTAAMRKRLIEAAIDCLGRLGYGATTLQVVTDAAEVSRGAVLHHFPTKVDLMIAVAEYAAEKQNRHVRRELAPTKPGLERYLAITEATWEVMTRPPAIALLEIMMGSRSDPELGARFPAVIEAFEAGQREDVWEQAQSVGITDKAAVEAMVTLHTAAMRGLAIEHMFSRDPTRAKSAMALLREYKRGLTGDLVTKPFA